MDLEKVLQTLRSRLGGATAVTRFAPSPTGYLHLGHVVNALYVWGMANALAGKVILRLENHDRTRCKPEFETAILRDLESLGLRPDLGTFEEFRGGVCTYRQSDSENHYLSALHHLLSQQLVYACDCSRKRILERTGQTASEELAYDGHCRERNLPLDTGLTLRMRMPDQVVQFEDCLQGQQTQHPSKEIGDFAIKDNHGNWTYQFAVVVDDLRQGVNLIIRGMDILSSTGRQLCLAEMLGQKQSAIYLHHPLLTDENGRKLSKRDFDADIHGMLKNGISRQEILLMAAKMAHLTLDEQLLEQGSIELIKNITT